RPLPQSHRPLRGERGRGGRILPATVSACAGPAPRRTRAPLRRHHGRGAESVSGNNNEKVAVYPGSFDPFTNGHLDVVNRALGIFDRLIVAVAANPDKRQPLFTVEDRVQLIRESLKGRDRVERTAFT